MALVNCPACARTVSASAAACPHCGHPMALSYARPVEAPPPNRRVQTIEQTGKVWKLQQLLAVCACVYGVWMIVAGMQPKHGENDTAIGVLALVGGVLWFLVARIGAWWCHG